MPANDLQTKPRSVPVGKDLSSQFCVEEESCRHNVSLIWHLQRLWHRTELPATVQQSGFNVLGLVVVVAVSTVHVSTCWDKLSSTIACMILVQITNQHVGMSRHGRFDSTCVSMLEWAFVDDEFEDAGQKDTYQRAGRRRHGSSTVHVSTSRDRPSFVTGQQVTHQTFGKRNCAFFLQTLIDVLVKTLHFKCAEPCS